MTNTKKPDFRGFLLIAWWLMWLALSQTALNISEPPSSLAILHFAVVLAAFTTGFACVGLAHRLSTRNGNMATVTPPSNSIRVRLLVYGLSASAMLLLLTSLYLSGAFNSSFASYFSKLRMGTQEEGVLTGIKLLDTLTKVFAFPVSYGLVLMILAAGVRRFRTALAICLLNFGLFSYLWQVNYPIIHLFWVTFFYLLSRYSNGATIDRRVLVGLILACALLVLSAMNRFGGDDDQLFGAIQRYVLGYHLIGFSFYDFHLAASDSILHVQSFGRSSLGFLDLVVEHAFRAIGNDYVAASSENSAFNDTPVPIGVAYGQSFNAFGTLAFTFYRDFGIVGLVVGGFLYGGAISYGIQNFRRSWISAAIFYLLASAWMVGMMVSPIEQTYFWFCIALLLTVRLVSRNWRIYPRRGSGEEEYSRPSGCPSPDRNSK